MRNYWTAAACLACLLGTTGCHPKIVTATCQPGAPSIEGYSGTSFGGLGYLNNNGDLVGNTYVLAPIPGKKGEYRAELAGHITANPLVGAPGNETANVSTEWDISGSGGLGSSDIASIQSKLTHTIAITLTNVSQKQVDVLKALDDPSNSDLKQRIVSHPETVFMVINPMISGDKGAISSATNNDTTGEVTISWHAKAEVTYKCSSDLIRSKIDAGGPTDLIAQIAFVQNDGTGKIFFVGGTHTEEVMVTAHTVRSSKTEFAPRKITLAPKVKQ